LHGDCPRMMGWAGAAWELADAARGLLLRERGWVGVAWELSLREKKWDGGGGLCRMRAALAVKGRVCAARGRPRVMRRADVAWGLPSLERADSCCMVVTLAGRCEFSSHGDSPRGKGRDGVAWGLPSRGGAGWRRTGPALTGWGWLASHGAALAGKCGLVPHGAALAGRCELLPHGGCPCGMGQACVA
jgi:hypothetical protein